MRDPDYKQKVIEAVRTREITEGYRETQRRGTIKQFEDPTNREKHANLTKAQMADPKARSRIAEKGWETRRKNRIEQGNQREQVG